MKALRFIGEQLKRIADGIEQLVSILRKPAARLILRLKGEIVTSPFILTDIQKVPYSISAVDVDGNSTSTLPSGDVVTVASSDPTILQVVPDATPAPGTVASGFLIAQKNLGTVQVTATDTSGLAPAAVSVQVVASAATGFSVGLGAAGSQ